MFVVCVFVWCHDLYVNLNLGALMFQECCHTRQKWNLWVCGLCQPAVCISKHVPIRVCLFVPTFVQTALCYTSDACLSFCSPILSHFLHLWRACSLHCGHTFTHFCSYTGAKSHYAHTFKHTHKGRSARTQPDLCTYTVICPFLHGKASMSTFTCSETFIIVGFHYECMFTFDLSFMCTERQQLSCVLVVCWEKCHVHWPLSVWEQQQWETEIVECNCLSVFLTPHIDRKRKIFSFWNSNTKVTCNTV